MLAQPAEIQTLLGPLLPGLQPGRGTVLYAYGQNNPCCSDSTVQSKGFLSTMVCSRSGPVEMMATSAPVTSSMRLR